MQESIYKKRSKYVKQDLIDFYEGVRFTFPFMTYRAIDKWELFDTIAKYANIFVTSTYIYACFYLSCNLYNCINLFILVSYFFTVTIKVGKKAEYIQKICGIQT